jgi:hypothetical protein
MTVRFSNQSHRIGFVRVPEDAQILSPVKVVQANPSAIASGACAIAPLEFFGTPRIQLSEIDIARAIKTLEDCQNSRKRIVAKERQVLLTLYDGEAHLHPSINLPSFQQFLLKQFGKTASLQYLKELSAGRKEQILKIPIGTYSVYQFKILERFRCFAPVGSKRDNKGQFRPGAAQFGVKPCPLQIERLQECWEIACSLHGSSQPDVKVINKAVQEMGQKYPEYRGRKPTSTVVKLKLQIASLEAENLRLREQLAALDLERRRSH